jgi:hypothetical protein
MFNNFVILAGMVSRVLFEIVDTVLPTSAVKCWRQLEPCFSLAKQPNQHTSLRPSYVLKTHTLYCMDKQMAISIFIYLFINLSHKFIIYLFLTHCRKQFTLGGHEHKMELYMLINLISLCVVNGFFTFAGILLNSGVIISLWKSPQLRRGTCHFMIFVLSCFDLLVIIVAHPTVILLSIAWAFENDTASQTGEIMRELHIILQQLELCVLLSMNIDRYLAIVHPFFYQARVTKGRILKFMILIQLIVPFIPILRRVSYIRKEIYIATAISIALFLGMMFFMNYKMFVVAKKKRRATPDDSTIGLKRNSTCIWVITCFVVCTSPLIVYSVLKFGASYVIQSGNFWTTFRLWSSTIAPMNCTFNCVILFWRNRILRRKVN